MALRAGKPPAQDGASAAAGLPPLIPCVLLRRGEVCLPGADGPIRALTPSGTPYDPFDVVDRLNREYPLLYVVDLDGVSAAEPQLDLLQELARDAALWIDGGVRNADQAIDILVTGARRAVLSSAVIAGPREVRRAWRLSSELVFEIESGSDGLVVSSDWGTTDPLALARSVREVGLDHLVVSPRGIDPDWNLVHEVAAGGPTWVDGSFSASDRARLAPSGARGGIFHIDRLLAEGDAAAPPPLTSERTDVRDDED